MPRALQPSARHVQSCAGHGGGRRQRGAHGRGGRHGGVAPRRYRSAVDAPSQCPISPPRLLSSLASRLAALGWGIGARGVCAHAYGRAGRHVSAALYAPIDHPASSQHANSQAVLVSLLQSCTPAFILGVKRWEYLSYYRLLSKSSYSALQVRVVTFV